MHDLFKKDTTATTRVKAFTNLKRQAEKMMENTNKRLKPALIWETVLNPFPDVHRGRGDNKNLNGITLSEEGGFYKFVRNLEIWNSCTPEIISVFGTRNTLFLAGFRIRTDHYDRPLRTLLLELEKGVSFASVQPNVKMVDVNVNVVASVMLE